MKKFNKSILSIVWLLALGLSSCAGIKTLTIQTYEPPQVILPDNIESLLIIDNTAPQPADIGHLKKKLGRKNYEKISVNTDSLSIIFTEALTQFLNEEDFFKNVKLYNKPLRSDNEYWSEKPISPERMLSLTKESAVDAIVTLDKLLTSTEWQDQFIQEGYPYASLNGKVAITMRIYLPNIDGKIPTIHFNDSLYWEGFDISDGMAYADFVVPHPENALKDLSVYAADKMTFVLAPHWINQERWYYTFSSSQAREAETFASQSKWQEAVNKWEAYYNTIKSKVDKAKVANNIALGYEMLDDMTTAKQWVDESQKLFNESTSSNSLERTRIRIYKSEIERRIDSSNKLNMIDTK